MSNWRERAKTGLDKTARFASEYGSSIGLTGAGVLGMGAAACMLGAVGADNPESAQLLRESSATFVISALLKMGMGAGIERMAELYLNRDTVKAVFKAAWEESSEPAADTKRGAVPVVNDETRGPQFQNALREVMKNLESNPEAKAFMVELLKNSSEARETLVNTIYKAPAPGASKQGLLDAVEAIARSASPDSEPTPYTGPR